MRHGAQTAAELAARQGLTANAVRQHLARLERDGVVAETPVRRGRTKPSLLFALTPAGERLFPQRHAVLLNALLRELEVEEGRSRVTDLFRKIGQRSARKYGDRFAGKDLGERVAELTKLLQEQGVVADFEPAGNGFILREHNCPFKDTSAQHPEVCTVVHTLMEEVLPRQAEQTMSIARGDEICEFHIPKEAEKLQ